MKQASVLLENNKKWVEEMKKNDATFFDNFDTQNPDYLWIGCCDSRVPETQIVDMAPGDIFVHRNIANLVSLSDISCMSAIQYAVEVLKVKHIIVCGHYGCGGVQASMNEDNQLGVVDNWLWDLNLIHEKHEKKLNNITDSDAKWAKFCEINVMEQVSNLGKSTIINRAWNKNQELTIHGWIYDNNNGLIKDLDVTFSSKSESTKIKENLQK
jgi:carbonic anhydrase